MRRNCRFPGEVICIKKDKYGSMYVPKEEKAPKEGKKPSGDNALDQIRNDIERMKDESIKKNRDNLDALYNIDMRNMSPSMRRLFASWTDGIKDVSASVETIADSQKAVVEAVAKYDDSIAALQLKATKNEASITQLVEVIGEDGEAITASIKAAVINDESFIELVADRVTIEGTAEFVTRDDLGDGGTTEISGNRIMMQMNGMSDDETSDIESTNKLNYNYWLVSGSEETTETIGSVMLKASGDETDTYSRYALLLETNAFETRSGNKYYPAIKLTAAGRISIESYGEMVYLQSESGACVVDALSNTRLRANTTWSLANSLNTPSNNDYVFATDGIYYGSKKLIST